ncbi:MAG: hypothetical protein NTV04_08555, partial [Deltaproteobacteria bacterium]|nr:hypothetical protein [Deltaproteobacteria bacterium]
EIGGNGFADRGEGFQFLDQRHFGAGRFHGIFPITLTFVGISEILYQFRILKKWRDRLCWGPGPERNAPEASVGLALGHGD